MISDLKILHTRTGSHVLLNNIRRERGYLFCHEQTWSLDERPGIAKQRIHFELKLCCLRLTYLYGVTTDDKGPQPLLFHSLPHKNKPDAKSKLCVMTV